MTDLTHLARALAIRAVSHRDDELMNGAALAVLRADALAGDLDDRAAAKSAGMVFDRLISIGVDDMPADPDDVAILLETLSQRLGGASRATAWRSIGLNPNRGRDLLARNSNALDWPIFFTLRYAALGVPST
jgi:hypothetical protein